MSAILRTGSGPAVRRRAMAGAILMLLGMGIAAGAAVKLRPSTHLSAQGIKVDLDAMVPKSFADWQVDNSIVPVAPTPELQEVINRTYDQTMSRTYIDGKGERIMLSLAYGSDYGTKGMMIHRPEICYPAQGYQIVRGIDGDLDVVYKHLPIRRLVATGAHRHEPITYWIVLGHQVTRFGFDMRLQQVKYGLSGYVPDGMLLRLSSVEDDDAHAYALQAEFARQFLQAIPEAAREKFAGRVQD